MEELFLEVKNLRKNYNGFEALKGISFEVKKGEIFGLLGTNGAGKTTTIKIIAGIMPPTSGEVKIQGKSIQENPIKIKSQIGYVPQDISIIPSLSAYENLRLIGKLYGVSKERVDYMLKAVNLFDRKDSLVQTFSGGMIRKLEIAMAMLHEPKLLLLDEPSVGLDPNSKLSIWNFLKSKKQDMAVLITTHDMNEAERLCDKIAIMKKGQIVAQGTLEELRYLVGDKDASLEDIFIKLTGENIEEDYQDIKSIRKTRNIVKRLS
ncbi:MAG: ABC transporter ATP-binding protein [Hydrogenobaculum sp.]|nr:MAG: ABC transporter [Hydrogenobaculum sp.]HEK25661.1 ATP-binding cassette domain-containing protein [Hydrogenobaculum sp.]